MNYVVIKIVGDEHALQEMYQNLQQQRRIVDETKEDVVAIQARVGSRCAALQSSIQERADAVEADASSGGISPMPVGFLLPGSDVSPEAQQVREDAARDAYEREAKLEKELVGRLERETTALTSLTESYTKGLGPVFKAR